jgi:hypothetical protein
VIDKDSTLTIAENITFQVGGTLNINKNADITVENGGKLILTDGASGTNNGTITIKSGGASYDLSSGGGSLTSSADTKDVIEAGGKVYTGGTSDETNLRIGSTDDAKAIIQLVDGDFTGTKGVYTLNGNAFIRGGYGLHHQQLIVKAGKKLTIELTHAGARTSTPYGVFLWSDIVNDTKITGEAGATIEVITPTTADVVGGLIYISEEDAGAVVNFYDENGTKLTVTNGYTIVGAGTYKWESVAGVNGWKKQPLPQT